MYIVHPPPLMNKRFYTRTLLSKWAANSISTWNNFQLFIQSERVCLWILTWSLYKSMNCLQILCGKRWKSVETARLDVLEAGSRWCYIFSFSFFAKGGKGLKQVGRMYLRPIVDDSICTALPTWPQTNEPASGRCGDKQASSTQELRTRSVRKVGFNRIFWDVGKDRSGMCSKNSQIKGISPVCVPAK